MSILYDPRTRKTKVWVFYSFFLVPLLLVALLFMIGPMIVKSKQNSLDRKEKKDVFTQLDAETQS